MTVLEPGRAAPAVQARSPTVRRDLRRVLGIVGGLDLVTLTVSLIVASTWHQELDTRWGWGTGRAGAPSGAATIAAWLLVLASNGGYNRRVFAAGPEEFRVVAQSSAVTAGVLGFTCFLLDLPLSRGFVLLAFLIGTPLLLVERYVARKAVHAIRNSGRLLHRVIAIGEPLGVSETLDALRRSKFVGYEVVGVCLPVAFQDPPPGADVPVLGTVREARALCDEVGADTVLVARGGYDSAEELRRIAWALEGSDIDLVVVPSLTDVAGPRIHMRPVAGLPLLHVEQPQAGKAGGLTKRIFDVVIATAALVVLSPVLVAVAVLVKLQDGGPVLFRQARVGRDGQPFGMVKFRSMVLDAEERLAELRDKNEFDGVMFKMARDPRITSVGRHLRRYSLDELPQLVNVLRGEMSLVGPRPPLPSEVAKYHDDVHRRLLVRPGLTGLWQVSGRSGLTWEESVRLDLYYVDNWSMTSDLVIMAKTLKAVIGGTGAY